MKYKKAKNHVIKKNIYTKDKRLVTVKLNNKQLKKQKII